MGLAVKRVRDPHDNALRVQSNVRELAKQGVRLPDQVQGFLLLLSTQARIAIMTLAGNSLSFGDVRKACKRYAGEFLRDPKEQDTPWTTHTVYVSQARAASVGAEEQEGDSAVETALAALAGESDVNMEETDVQEILLAYKESRTVAWRTAGERWLQTRDRAHQWWETIPS